LLHKYADKIVDWITSVLVWGAWLIAVIYYYTIDKSWMVIYNTADLMMGENEGSQAFVAQLLAIPLDVITSLFKIGLMFVLLYLVSLWLKSTNKYSTYFHKPVSNLLKFERDTNEGVK
jgi:hypothetical protein